MPMRALLLSLGFAVALAGCQRDAADTTTPTPAKSPVTASTSHDALSYAEPDKVAITDLALDLKVDFGTKTIAGTATYTLDWKDEDARQLVLDTRDLAIDRVEGAGKDEIGRASCRESVFQYVSISVFVVSLKKKIHY